VAIPNVTTWLSNIFGKDKEYQMKRENGYKFVTQSFFGILRTERLCEVCNTPFKEGALDFLSDEFVCPYCENRKENK